MLPAAVARVVAGALGLAVIHRRLGLGRVGLGASGFLGGTLVAALVAATTRIVARLVIPGLVVPGLLVAGAGRLLLTGRAAIVLAPASATATAAAVVTALGAVAPGLAALALLARCAAALLVAGATLAAVAVTAFAAPLVVTRGGLAGALVVARCVLAGGRFLLAIGGGLVAAQQLGQALDQAAQHAGLGLGDGRLHGRRPGTPGRRRRGRRRRGRRRGGRGLFLLQGGRGRLVVDHGLHRGLGPLYRLAEGGLGLAAHLGVGGELETGEGGGAFLVHMVVAQALDVVVGRVHLGTRQQHHPHALATFDVGQHGALLVEQVGGHRHRQDGADLGAALLHGLLLDQAHDRERQGAHVADGPLAVAARADHAAGLAQGGAQALTGHLHQAEAGDTADLHPGAVQLQGVAHAVLDLALVARRAHVDEVDHHQAADVTQAQLAGDLVGRLQVGLQRRLLDVAATGGASRVDVDGDQRLGVVDDDGAAGGELHLALIGGLDLRLDLEAREERHLVDVELDLLLVGGHHLADEGQGLLVHRLAVDQHLADVLAQVVAHGANDDVGFAVDQEGGGALAGLGGDRLPHLDQVVQVPL